MSHPVWTVLRCWIDGDWYVVAGGRGYLSVHYGPPVAYLRTKKLAMDYARELRETWGTPAAHHFEREHFGYNLEDDMKTWMLTPSTKRKQTPVEMKISKMLIKKYPHDTQCDIYDWACHSVPNGEIDSCSCGATQLRRKAKKRFNLLK